jgi:hypothetical protein
VTTQAPPLRQSRDTFLNDARFKFLEINTANAFERPVNLKKTETGLIPEEKFSF